MQKQRRIGVERCINEGANCFWEANHMTRKQTINQNNKFKWMKETPEWMNEWITDWLTDWWKNQSTEGSLSRFSGKPSSRYRLGRIFSTALSDRGPHLRKHRPSLGNPGATIPIKTQWFVHFHCLHTNLHASGLLLRCTFPLANYCCYLCGWHDDAKAAHEHSSISRKFAN
jgi:hypothetical protein